MKNKLNKQLMIYQGKDGAIELHGDLDRETIWATQKQIAKIFDIDRTVVTKHINNIFKDGELDEKSNVQKMHIANSAKPVKFYNLDIILAVGYRTNSVRAIRFRRWATMVLKEYIVKGFTMDDERLKNLGGGNYWKELLDRIRDIRSSEKVLYRQVLDLYATSVDYNPKSPESRKFFKIVQNKLHYAAHGHTASEVIAKRADANKPFMGLLTFSGGEVSRKDIAIAKNYLTEDELKKLNNIVSAFFDLAEVKAMNKEPMYMQDWIEQLDKLIQTFDGKILKNAGSVSHKQALKKAEREYRKYQSKTISNVEKEYLESIKGLEKKAKKQIHKTKNK